MRIAVVGASVVASLVFATFVAALLPSVGYAQRPAVSGSTSANGGLVTLAMPVGEHLQQVTVIDPATRSMGVYHIDTSTGAIVLKSVRSINYDLQMMEFNGTTPLPREIRAMLEQK